MIKLSKLIINKILKKENEGKKFLKKVNKNVNLKCFKNNKLNWKKKNKNKKIFKNLIKKFKRSLINGKKALQKSKSKNKDFLVNNHKYKTLWFPNKRIKN